MFESMLESSVAKRKRQNPWAYLISISVQTILLGAEVAAEAGVERSGR